MARLRRRWRVVKWAGFAFSVLVIIAWGVSYSPLVVVDGTCILDNGRIYQRYVQDDSGCTAMDRSRIPAVDMSIGLFPILLFVAIPTATANTSGICPECGANT